MAFLACGSLTSQAGEEAKLAAEAPEIARAVTVRIEGPAPRSLCQESLSCGTRAALISMMGLLVFSLLLLIRAFQMFTSMQARSACVVAAVVLAGSGVAGMSMLVESQRYRLTGSAGSEGLSEVIGSYDDTSVYLAVVEEEGSTPGNLPRGKHLLLHTSLPKEDVVRGTRLYLTLDSDDPGPLETASNAPTVTAH
ncbi:hypothetical protein DB346_04785 [Verrucomicrobia bacterium LW23]|nr:hypothetical protein DB346_04785 [Verrucomicrobia bacterium LW23]